MRIFRLSVFYFMIFFFLTACKNEVKEKDPVAFEPKNAAEVENLTSEKKLKNVFSEEIDSTDFFNPIVLAEFYRKKDYQPVWDQSKNREDLFSNIENIESEGLFPEDYHFSELKELLKSAASNSPAQNTKLELLLTDAFLRLSHDLGTGKLNPKQLYRNWGTPLNSVNSEKLLEKAISEGNISKILDSLTPKSEVYTGLKKALKEIDKAKLSEEKITVIPSGKLIKPGEQDERIPIIAKRLNELGFLQRRSDSTTFYKENIQASIQRFQQTHGLEEDGIIGNSTISNLNMSKKDRYNQILINMERWRWYPRDLGEEYILINIPDFQLKLVKDKDILETHKIMVGIPSRQTPIFSDEIEYVIYNPTWTIPPTIEKKDVIPGMRRDPNYLGNRSLNVYDSENNRVDPAKINWNSSEPLKYIYRQGAGPTNPLGQVKIIYPNKYMVYLHDTPHRELFDKRYRARSSGCVRVQNALKLAKYLLNNQPEYDDEKIGKILNSGKTTEIPVTKKVRVHHFYWTAYPVRDSIKFIDDLYNLDKKLWENFKPSMN